VADLAKRVGLLELGRSGTGRKSSIDLDGIFQSKLFKQPDYSQDISTHQSGEKTHRIARTETTVDDVGRSWVPLYIWVVVYGR
jgi:hypothetical protein